MLAMQPQEFNKPPPLKSAMQRRSSFADNNDGEQQPYKAVNKGKKGGGKKGFDGWKVLHQHRATGQPPKSE